MFFEVMFICLRLEIVFWKFPPGFSQGKTVFSLRKVIKKY